MDAGPYCGLANDHGQPAHIFCAFGTDYRCGMGRDQLVLQQHFGWKEHSIRNARSPDCRLQRKTWRSVSRSSKGQIGRARRKGSPFHWRQMDAIKPLRNLLAEGKIGEPAE